MAVSGDTVAVGAYTDLIGNQNNQGSVYLFGFVPDTTPPDVISSVNCPEPGQGPWCRGTVQVGWFVTDPDSPVTSTSGCNTATITSDTPAAGTVFTCEATSAGGTASEPVTVFRDGTPPVVTLMSPGNGASYTVGSTVNATYHCTDAGSGTASCEAPVASGSAIDTALAGTRGFTVNAEDEVGNTRSVSHTYTVHPQVFVGGVAATIVGTAGNDTLVGTPGRDVIAGLGGNDTISGLGGNDSIDGGPGNDVIKGGAGRDTLTGGSGNDKLNGGSGTDRCKGGSGRDTARSCERASGVP
jgi:Ca2+-binding RTX toxin-like protein